MYQRKIKKLFNLLLDDNETIATMESCTGGALASAITNIPFASKLLKFSAITYSNEYKIKMGVSKQIIDKYSVYSIETAMEMSKSISDYANSDYGIGITGRLNINNKENIEPNLVFISIYIKNKNIFANEIVEIKNKSRKVGKNKIIDIVINRLLELKKEDNKIKYEK